MNNTSVTSYNQTRKISHEVQNVELYQVFWLIGFAVSCVCLVMQIVLYVLRKGCRRADEKILTQMTFARVMVTFCEYWIMNHSAVTPKLCKDLIYTVYFYVDFSLVMWMFVFTKNLYDKIVIVYATRTLNLLMISILVWTLSLPFGLLAIFLLKQPNTKYFFMYFNIYACLKFIIVTLNAIFYIKIFYVAFRKGVKSQRNFSDISKTAFMAFLLVVTTCVQVFITDVLALFNIKVSVKIFCVINSFHAVLITLIFIIIFKAKMREAKIQVKNTVTMTEFSNDYK